MAKNKKDSIITNHFWNVLGVLIFFSALIIALMVDKDVTLLNPKGVIANEQYRLLIISTLIMVGFATPILFAIYYFAWKYRETNEKAVYDPSNKPSKSKAFLMWSSPFVILVILASFMLPATQKLEPQKRIEASNKETMKIQVIAMRWKWLFIYPEQKIATVNYVQIPVNTPVEFELTADETPMSSFWIPHLGGMLYAMTEHVNRLNLMADTIGDYEGSAAEINGSGFAGMRFKTKVTSRSDFNKWSNLVSESPTELSKAEYSKLLIPSEYNEAAYFSNASPDIYQSVLSKYSGSHSHSAAPVEHGGGH